MTFYPRPDLDAIPFQVPAGARAIPLTHGAWTLVDAEDYETLLEMGPWHLGSGGYARRGKVEDGRQPLMHTVISGITMIDHRNRNPLDNRRVNLRAATRTQNNWNVGLSRNNRSGYKGVSYDPSRSAWKAYIGLDSRYIHLGRYRDPRDAAVAYDRAARKLYGEFACTNEDLGLAVDDGRTLLQVRQARRVHTGGTAATMRIAA